MPVWEEDNDTLKLDQSYCMTKIVVRVYNGDFTLSFQQMGSKLNKIEDIGDIMEDSVDSTESSIEGVVIITVKDLEKFKVCMFCKRKVNESGDIGICLKCYTVQKLSKCVYNEMAKIVVESPGMENARVVAYADVLNAILVEGEMLNEQNLLRVKPFDLTYNMYNVITSIAR